MSAVRVALDGPSGTGKSSVARRLAVRLEAGYLDTGAMYRAATLALVRRGIAPEDETAMVAVLAQLDMRIGTNPASEQITVGGEDVAGEIRGSEVTDAVSAYSAVPRLRDILVARQRAVVSETDRIVVEGRDIGTVVLPDADVKIYLTASAAARAHRRNRQNIHEGRGDDYAAVLEQVRRRDEWDSTRKVSPLRAAPDAIEIDTSQATLDQVVTQLYHLVLDKTAAAPLMEFP